MAKDLARAFGLVGLLIGLTSVALFGGSPLARQSATTSAPAQPQAPTAGRGGVPVQGAEPDIAVLDTFDRDRNRRLDRAERDAAREYLTAHPELRRPARARTMTRTGSPGAALDPKNVKSYPASVPLYDGATLRTFFLQFERADWEQELAAFYHTDVLVPATLVVDGRTYRDVGVSFRGNNSFTAVPEGLKRPLSLTLDFVHDQHLLGHRSINLLNSNQDPTYLRSLLYLDVARTYMPALRANFVRVAINGESWGIYVNQQTFSREFERETFKTTNGTRWKSPNNSVGGGFSHLGDDVAQYRRWYEMKDGDNPAAWKALINVSKVLNETPLDQLEAALAPVMDVDAVLRFLALDVALVNNDGYWNDGSDFNVYLTEKGRFLATPHDANEGFRGRGGTGAQPDPLVGLTDTNKALRSRLLAVPALRDRYLAYVGDIAEKWLDWNRLGPIVERYQNLIADDVGKDTRKLDTIEAFRAGVYGAEGTPPPVTSIKGFADQRRAALLAHPEIVRVRAPPPAQVRPPETVWRELQLVGRFDRDGDRRLDAVERTDAREYLAAHPELKPRGRQGRMGPGSPGPRVSAADVTSYPRSVPLYDEGTLRTLFLQFDAADWERELEPFHFTDVDVPAVLTVDRVAYPGTGVHFRGHNSFIGVVSGRKRPLGLSPDFVNPAQRLLGYRGLHLHNAYQDASFVRGLLFFHIARTYLPAPKANFVRVVVNGESWGLYVNHQRFDTDFLRDHFGTTQGTRWRSLNNAQGGGLSYLGEDVAAYKDAYEIKSKDNPKAWSALIRLCRVLNEAAPDRLSAALEPILDVDGALRFLALDNALMNGDGYWEDGSDFNLYLDPKGRFHLVPYDVNEAFRPIGGARATGPGRGATLDPFAGSTEPRKALLHKLLAAPDLRQRYLQHVRRIAETWLDWSRLSPIVERYRALIADDVARDSRKMYTTEEFTASFAADPGSTPAPLMTLKGFVEARRAFLLGHPEIRTGITSRPRGPQ